MRLAERYVELAPDRQPYLDRARACAALTVQAVCPPEGQSASNILPQTYQSFGARATVNLAAKLLMALLPPGASSFNLKVPAKVLLKQQTMEPPPDVTLGLAKCEKLVNEKIETLQWRRPTYTTLLHLIVAGNMAEYITPTGHLKQYMLEQYVAVRNWDGKAIEVVTAEKMKVRALPTDLRDKTDKKEDADCTLYTRFELIDENTYSVQQDLDNVEVTPLQTFNGLMPCNALAWELVPGENYGRSHCEANYADLMALDATTQQLREAGALASRNLIFVRPNAAGGNLRKRIAEARNGAVLSGNGGPNGDIQPFQFNNGSAMQTMQSQIQDIQRGLAQAFLLTGDLRRDAERVTAYELQMLASEIEQGLGGVYSLLAVELQAWRLRKLIAQMQTREELPKIGKDSVSIEVTTGLEALGKDAQVNKARTLFGLFNEVPQAFQEQVAQRIDFNKILTPTVAAVGFPGAVKDDATVAAEQAQQQQAQMASDAVKGAAGPIAGAMAQNQLQPPQ
ncbi:portal protein [Variovorax sp. J22G73]|uniref:portal protein n=1 Tax=unclassified Variovorax TaxID=663243 RepID=UPI002574DA32|nr:MULTISPECIES: portal protein [unclassified Variovorax]MDM0006455.1 portal protein [Variovorax sp. J22R203]MDM0097522.1 portal protein [Variovorax sp. J22G73]